MRIGELAKRSGASARAIRYYERHGLLAADRAANGYREFTLASVRRVCQIKELLAHGFGVRDARALLSCYDGAAGRLRPCATALERYASTLRSLNQRISALVVVRDRAQRGLAALRRRSR